MKNSIWDMPKVAQIFERHSQTVKSRYVYRSLFFSDHCIKQIAVSYTHLTLPTIYSV